jgi:hypothetical protein
MRIWGVDFSSFKREQEGLIRSPHFKPQRKLWGHVNTLRHTGEELQY